VDEGLAALRAELARRGLRPRTYQRSLLVPIGGDGTYDAIRDSVADLGLALSRMERRRHQVEELFRDAAGATGGDTLAEAADAR
jgi:ABC-2 type transport system ATP-binding protein